MYTQVIEKQIEDVRSKMYDAYLEGDSYTEVLELSQRLDELLNKLPEPTMACK
ncbi:aspartyl-phosphate phosphatase Spo0E family protein [Halobacillus fulvus]|nr:aspartyl-phosphate phosphatase Spo0E family protein [Halobacillus fulvus]